MIVLIEQKELILSHVHHFGIKVINLNGGYYYRCGVQVLALECQKLGFKRP
jgi:hypothetical protein